MFRALLSYVNIRASVRHQSLRIGAKMSAVIQYVNMRATYGLTSPSFDSDGTGGGDGGSVFNTRAINEWTFNG